VQGSILDFDGLVDLRRIHETNGAKRAVRGRGKQADVTKNHDVEREQVRSRSRAIFQLGNRYEAILREVNKPSEGSGISRIFHWTGSTPRAGNSFNAALVAGQKATQVGIL
jgi:hypothetical protein